jgi:hypothetical protein
MRKIFVTALIMVGIFGLFEIEHADAGIFRSCVRRLMGMPPTISEKARQEYRIFIRARAKDPTILPPAKKATRDTTAEEMLLGFQFWWMPGNAWYNLMHINYDGRHMLLQPDVQRGAQFQPPDLSQVPRSVIDDLTVPDTLPDVSSPPITDGSQSGDNNDFDGNGDSGSGGK